MSDLNNLTKPIVDFNKYSERLLNWANQKYEIVYYLQSNQTKSALNYSKYELLIGLGNKNNLINTNQNFNEICDEINSINQWKMMVLPYELHRDFGNKNFINTKFNCLIPELVLRVDFNDLTKIDWIDNSFTQTTNLEEIIEDFENYKSIIEYENDVFFNFKEITRFENYINNVENIKEQIVNGDFYEMNYCQKFVSNSENIDYVGLFNKLKNKTQAPFSSLLKLEEKYILSLSPERFIAKENNKIFSQPIKGTNLKTENNHLQIEYLKNSEKEKAENVMIVDLVRNDLAKISETGTIKVEELFGIYTYKYVNQMVSTVSSNLLTNINFQDVIKALFPMGSMTGAPKIEVMKNIEKYEDTERGIYSGSIGYIDPQFNFDFNVVIRTLIFENNHVHYHVGGAITYDSDAKKEYEECLNKAKAFEL